MQFADRGRLEQGAMRGLVQPKAVDVRQSPAMPFEKTSARQWSSCACLQWSLIMNPASAREMQSLGRQSWAIWAAEVDTRVLRVRHLNGVPIWVGEASFEGPSQRAVRRCFDAPSDVVLMLRQTLF